VRIDLHRPLSTPLRYGIAIFAVTAAALLRGLLDPVLGTSAPFFIQVGAVAAAVWIGGFGPAVVAAVLGYAFGNYFFVHPRNHLGVDPMFWVTLIPYGVTVTIVIWFGVMARVVQRRQVREARRRSEDLLEQELADTELLRDVGAELVREESTENVYEKILDAAIAIMRSDFGSMQMLRLNDETREELLLLAYRGFDPEAARYWNIVGVDSGTTCGHALRSGNRVVVPDLERTELTLGEKDRELWASNGIRATQTTPLVSRDGRVVGMISTHWHEPHQPSERDLRLMDILARQAADLIERVRSLHRLRENARLLDLSNDAIIVRDPNDRIIYWNHGAEELYGYPRTEALGQRTHDLLHTEHPEPLEEIRQKLERDGRWSGEVVHQRSDGKRVHVMSRWSLDRGPDGRPAAILETNNDITERKVAEEALRSRTAQHETLLRQAPLGVFLVDADMRVREVNPVALPAFGDIPGGVIGHDIEKLIRRSWNPDYADKVVGIFRHTLATGEPYHTSEIAERRLDRGVIEYYEWRLDRIMLPEGRYGLVCYFRDISKQVQVRQAIEESDRRKDEFLAVLAHELRNPLGPVRNAAHYLKLKNLADPELKRPVEMIERQVTHMARLIDDLLDTSRIARGVLELRLERVRLVEVIEAAVDACRDEIDGRAHSLRVRLPKQAVELDADRHRLVQAFGNLISNASKYTPAGGKIDVTAGIENGMLLVSITDNGVGIPPGKVTEIFELFAQLDRSLERQGGLGIGLTLARQLIQLHGGTIEARSKGIGYGSTFFVTLPIASHQQAEPPESNGGHARATEPRRVLVADDNADAAESLALLLQMDHHKVKLAFDGEAAFRAASEFQPDVAFLDIGMPNLNGYEVARRIRGEPWGRSMRLVALTGWGQERDRRLAEDAGFDAHLVKPVSPDKLTGLLAEIAERPRTEELTP
jgi:PAS domain S-box-containing protein